MTTRSNLNREDWILAAQRVLVKGGVDAVRVDLLAKELGITRGSFYYHFENRGELLEAILSHWRMRATEDVIQFLRQSDRPPRQQLAHLLELPLHGQSAREAAAIELGIRAWARRDEQARKAIDEVDRHRLNYIEGLLIQAGAAQADAGDRANLLYAYQLSQSIMHNSLTSSELAERHGRILGYLLP